MTEQRTKRKLSAILSGDVEGYSRLMGEDELETVRTLEAYREMIAEVIRNYNGRVVDSIGDNMLAEFTSVVDAVESAVEIQKELRAKNAELPDIRRMRFRIGINLGDVIQEGERIYGDGVNIAARIEGLAEAAGICVSRNVYEQVKNKLALEFEYLGEHSVKNIWAERYDRDLEDIFALHYADGFAGLGNALSFAGRQDEAVGWVKRAVLLNPMHPAYYQWNLGHAYFLTRHHEEAIEAFKRALNRNPNFHPAHVYLALIYSELGRDEEAWVEWTEFVSRNPQTSPDAWRQRLPYKDEAVLERMFETLAKILSRGG